MISKTNTLIATMLTLATVPSALAAPAPQPNEGKIRQVSNNRVINGSLGGEVRFTVAGRLSDVVTVELGNGTHFARMTIRDLRNSFLSVGSYRGSGGETAVRIRISNAQQFFNNGRVLIHRGNLLIDADRVRLR